MNSVLTWLMKSLFVSSGDCIISLFISMIEAMRLRDDSCFSLIAK